MGVGLRLKEILRERKMTIKQLAEKADISLNTLYSITKRDPDKIDHIILKKIATSLGISEDSIYTSSVHHYDSAMLHSQVSALFPNLSDQSIDNLIRFFSNKNEQELNQLLECIKELVDSHKKNPDLEVIEITTKDGRVSGKLTITKNAPSQTE